MLIMGTDFDDTLYFHDGRGIRRKDVEAIRHFQKEGNLFGLCTGRSPSMMDSIREKTENRVQFDFTVFSNGACVVWKDQVIYKAVLDPHFILKMIEACPNAPIIIHHSSGLYSSVPVKVDAPCRVLTDGHELLEGDCYGISLDFHNPEAKKCIEKFKDTDQAVCVLNSRFCDFSPLGATKGHGLLVLAEKLGVPRVQTAAIGDSYNDESMLKDAGTGFTFADSPEEVREAADVLVDGIWEAIAWLHKENA